METATDEETTTSAKHDYDAIARGALKGTGYDSYYYYYFRNFLSSVDRKLLTRKSYEVLVRINMQTPDIAGGVHVGKSDLDVGAGDQGIVLGYASDETEVSMPLTHILMPSKLARTSSRPCPTRC